MLPYGDDGIESDVTVPVDHLSLAGTLGVPSDARGIVVFAHGSGSSRFSKRNRCVARVFRDAGLGTLLLDLLSRREEEVDEVTRHHRFDIEMLAARLVATVDWLGQQLGTRELTVGLFGASTGGAAALVAAAQRPDHVKAVVSRGGRPDLAEDSLPAVRSPTLLIVGERDEAVIALNEAARDRMRAYVRLAIVPNATHLFEEPGTLDEVAALARDWLLEYLAAASARDSAAAAHNE